MDRRILKEKGTYRIEEEGELLAEIKVYRNAHHLKNCYVDFDREQLEGIVDRFDFQVIADREKSPLQVMLSSNEVQKALFLEERGFKKVRSCSELVVEEKDLKLPLAIKPLSIKRASQAGEIYRECCHLLFHYYKASHETVSPLTDDFETFAASIPTEVFYTMAAKKIQHVAFVEGNELAYVASNDQASFPSFALATVQTLFRANESIFFEADDVDWAATLVKNLFSIQNTETFDTWIFSLTNRI